MPFIRSFRALATLSTAFVAVSVAGCGGVEGPAREPISGVVTLDGKPLDQGLITFIPESGGDLIVSGLVVDGAFDLPRHEGPGLGAHRVEVRARKETGKVLKNREDPENPIKEQVEAVPVRYNQRSELRAEVLEGADNRFTYELAGSQPAVKRIASNRR